MDIFFGSPRFRLGWILVLIATLNTLGWAVYRWSYENSLRHVQITVDYDDTRMLTDAYQMPHLKTLQQLKAAGVNSVALYQQTLGTLRDNGRLTITPREESERLYPAVPWATVPKAYRTVVTASAENQNLLTAVVWPHLQAQKQPLVPPRLMLLQESQKAKPGATVRYAILLPASRQLLNDAQMGFDPAQVEAAHRAGFEITARLGNPANLTLDRVRTLLDEAEQIGAHVVIFSEDEVMGYQTLIPAVGKEMKKRRLLFGTVEFTKQKGVASFSEQSDGLLVRVHSVSGEEAAKATLPVLVDRYTRAVKERDIRVAYIRLMKQFKGEAGPPENLPEAYERDTDYPVEGQAPGDWVQNKNALDQNLEMIREIRQEITTAPLPGELLRPGLVISSASPFNDYPMSYLAQSVGGMGRAKLLRYLGLFLTGLGAVGGTLLVLNLFFDLGRRARALWLALGVLIVAVLAWSPGMGAKLIALNAGCFFPFIGLMWGGLPRLWDRREPGDPPEKPVTVWRTFLLGTSLLLRTSLLMALGALIIIAALNHWKYMSKADEFLGEKATELLPLMLAALAFGGGVFPQRVQAESAAAARRRLRERVRHALDQPFTTRVAVLSVVTLVAGAVWIARTGNESGMEISSFELRLRATLEKVFVTRPRTKEIFLGHPAMIFAVWFALRRRWLPALCAVIIVAMGQSDMVNTFEHIHTPIFYSLWRSMTSVLVGAVIGGLALAVYDALTRRLWGRGDDNLDDTAWAPAPATASATPEPTLDGASTDGPRL